MATADDRKQAWLDSLADVFDSGRALAQQLCDQNEELRRRVAELTHELEQRSGPDTRDRAARQASTEERLAQLESQNEQLTQDCADLERQNSNYMSLYVASSQIHATLVIDEVLRSIKEIIVNLTGADAFGLYLLERNAQEFRRAAWEGLVDPADEAVPFGDNYLSRVARAGSLSLDIEAHAMPSGNQPIAVLPLKVGEQTIGLIVLFRLLVHKADFDAFDMELFDLLAAHAATALMSSSMYRRLERRTQTLQGLLDLLKTVDVPEAEP
jgi:transcriptional regulator with GAF, ATPase, and Fis domain